MILVKSTEEKENNSWLLSNIKRHIVNTNRIKISEYFNYLHITNWTNLGSLLIHLEVKCRLTKFNGAGIVYDNNEAKKPNEDSSVNNSLPKVLPDNSVTKSSANGLHLL